MTLSAYYTAFRYNKATHSSKLILHSTPFIFVLKDLAQYIKRGLETSNEYGASSGWYLCAPVSHVIKVTTRV